MEDVQDHMRVKDDLHHLVAGLDGDGPRSLPRIVHTAPLWLRFLDWLDARILAHGFYGFCCWLASHPSWRPTSAAHPRPNGKPFYIDPNCPQCGAPLVLLDSLEHPPLSPNQVWYDEWVCRN